MGTTSLGAAAAAGLPDGAATRLALYEQDGADGVFVPGLPDPADIAERPRRSPYR
ncbi:hypothetical protein ABT025_36845 [Streptomyces sp. NPDC002809]|uniref:hypothetical protein n=1 Tax=Streptomyces sp. NPDC002809 TaxID=3154433 RepID=UPI00331EC9BD